MFATAFSIFYLLSFSLYLPKAHVASGNTTLPSPHCTNTALPVIILLSEAIFFCNIFHFTDPLFPFSALENRRIMYKGVPIGKKHFLREV